MRPGTLPTTSTTPPVVHHPALPIERLARCGERVPRWGARGDPAPDGGHPAPDGVHPAPARGQPAPADLLDLDRLAMMVRLALDGVTLPLARSAALFVRQRQFTAFGFARLDDCARERFDRTGRWMRDQAALGEAVDRLPGLDAAIAGLDGRDPLGTVAALLIARVADPASLPEWVDLARSRTVRELRAAVVRAADATYIRDGWRCSAPACTSRRNLEEHHVVYRSRGGDDDDPANFVALCRVHHQHGEHAGLMRVRGRAPLGLVWRLGRADLGTWWRNERRLPPRREGSTDAGVG